MLSQPKEMNAVSTKVLLRFFPTVCPFAPSIFSQVTPRHLQVQTTWTNRPDAFHISPVQLLLQVPLCQPCNAT
jgi:hypothetical protein